MKNLSFAVVSALALQSVVGVTAQAEPLFVVMDENTENYVIRKISGGTFEADILLESVAKADLEGNMEIVADVTGDGVLDIILQNDAGQVRVWQVEGDKVSRKYDLDAPIAKEWTIWGAGDLDGDGTEDLIWRNDNGRVHYWKMVKGQRVGGFDIGAPVADENWHITGVGDVDGDGTDDIVWVYSGETYERVHYWKVQNGQRQGGYDIGTVQFQPDGSEFLPSEVADMNGDGVEDILFFNGYGDVQYWAMGSGKIIQTLPFSPISDTILAAGTSE